ncbi:hypothetical protein Tco_0418267 [Tanacetum coccineum]
MDSEVPNFEAKKIDANRYKSSESSSFNPDSGDASNNLNVDGGDDEEDEVDGLRVGNAPRTFHGNEERRTLSFFEDQKEGGGNSIGRPKDGDQERSGICHKESDSVDLVNPIFESYEMSTSKTYQQSLADAGSETRPPVLKRFEMFIPNNSKVPKLQTAKDLQADALLHYDADMELMNLILLSFLNDIYNFVDA